MAFTPNTPVLRLQAATTVEAFAWLASLQSETPYAEPMRAIPLAEVPKTPELHHGTRFLENGPLSPWGICPQTGRRLSLHLFRDASGAILREGNTPSGYEVLPSPVSLGSDVWDVSISAVPYELRQAAAPRLHLQAYQGHLRWQAHNALVDQGALLALFTQAIEATALQILEADPVVDARAHPRLPEGARYAPFSRWEEIEISHPALDRLALAMKGAWAHQEQEIGPHSLSIHLNRRPVLPPWARGKTKPPLAEVYIHYGAYQRQPAIGLRDQIRKLFLSNMADIPDNVLYGPDALLINLHIDPEAETAHSRMAAMMALSEFCDADQILHPCPS